MITAMAAVIASQRNTKTDRLLGTFVIEDLDNVHECTAWPSAKTSAKSRD
jgi:hypothetical protein